MYILDICSFEIRHLKSKMVANYKCKLGVFVCLFVCLFLFLFFGHPSIRDTKYEAHTIFNKQNSILVQNNPSPSPHKTKDLNSNSNCKQFLIFFLNIEVWNHGNIAIWPLKKMNAIRCHPLPVSVYNGLRALMRYCNILKGNMFYLENNYGFLTNYSIRIKNSSRYECSIAFCQVYLNSTCMQKRIIEPY